MTWEFKDISISDIESKASSRSEYSELYDKIFSLEVGRAFEVETESRKRANNMRTMVSARLKSKGLSDKYIVCIRLNKFYCGRIK